MYYFESPVMEHCQAPQEGNKGGSDVVDSKITAG
jgi:hypothetical protein